MGRASTAALTRRSCGAQTLRHRPGPTRATSGSSPREAGLHARREAACRMPVARTRALTASARRLPPGAAAPGRRATQSPCHANPAGRTCAAARGRADAHDDAVDARSSVAMPAGNAEPTAGSADDRARRTSTVTPVDARPQVEAEPERVLV